MYSVFKSLHKSNLSFCGSIEEHLLRLNTFSLYSHIGTTQGHEPLKKGP